MAFRESGKIDSISYKYVGKMPKTKPSDAQVLSLGSLFLPFSFILSVVVLVFLVLIGEKILDPRKQSSLSKDKLAEEKVLMCLKDFKGFKVD